MPIPGDQETPNSEHTAGELPAEIMGRFVAIDQVVYKPPKHVYGVDANGTRHHISHASVLEWYGYPEHPNPQEDYEARTGLSYDNTERPGTFRSEQSEYGERIEEEVEPSNSHRFRGYLLGASVAIAELPGRAVESYRNSSGRKKKIIWAAGALAVATAGLLTWKYGFSGNSPGPEHSHPGLTSPRPPHVRELSPPPAPHPAPHIPYRPKHARARIPDQFSLPKYNPKTGAGTVWNTAKRYAGILGFHHLNESKIEKVTTATLRRNDITWTQARRLPKDFIVHMISPKRLRGLLK